MIDFAALEPAILILVARLAGCPAVMLDAAQPMNARALARVQIFGVTSPGTVDDVAYERATDGTWGAGAGEDAPSGGAEAPAVETVTGWREMTIRIRVEALFQDPGNAARYYLERMRTRLRMTATVEAFKAAGMGYLGTLLLTDLSVPLADAGRIQSVGVLDLRVNVVARESAADYLPTIERATARRGV